MARGRNYYLRGASNVQDISPETKKLLVNKRDPDDLRWQHGPGIQEPLEMDPATKERRRAMQYIIPYFGSRINDSEDKVKYYPHAGEEIPDDPPSPVLMVRRVKTVRGEPWYNKNYCIQLGLYNKREIHAQTSEYVFLANIPSVSLVLFKIKHLIEIIPVTFPNGMPDDFDTSKYGYRLTPNGEFLVFDDLVDDPEEIEKSAEWIKMSPQMVRELQYRNWQSPWKTILGHDNYLTDTRWRDNEKAANQYEKNKKLKWSSPK